MSRSLLTGLVFLSLVAADSTAAYPQSTAKNSLRNPAQSVPPSVLAQIKQQAAARYPTDYEMQEYKIDQQTFAYIAVETFDSPQVPKDILEQIKAAARSRYPNDYEMQQYKLEQQSDAYVTVANYSNSSVPENILSQITADAKAKYPTDYEMQEYKITQQAEAYSRTNK